MFSTPHRPRPSLGAVSVILSCVAVFFALGGVGYAAKTVAAGGGSGAMFSRIDNVVANATSCGSVSGTVAGTLCDPGLEQFSSTVATTARDMAVTVGNGNAGIIVTLQVNSTDTALKCTTDSLGRCTDTTDAVSIPAQSFVRFTVVNPNANAVGALIGWRSTQ